MRALPFLTLLILCFLLVNCGPARPDISAQKSDDAMNAVLWAARAYYETSLGNDRLAEEDYHYALQLDPQSGAIHNNYGVFLCRHKNYTLAHEQFLAAMKQPKYPNRTMAYKNLMICYKKVERGNDTH